MTKTRSNRTKIVSALLCLILCGLTAVSQAAFAGADSPNEIGSSGGSAVTPVSLTTTNGGLWGGEITPTKLDVSLPTSLPLAMSDDGAVATATDTKIINRSYGAVRVKNVTITAADGWNLCPFGDKSSLAYEKVDSNKIGFALRIGGGQLVKTESADRSQYLIYRPVSGCYLTGAGDPAGSAASIEYHAIVTPVSSGLESCVVANVVFVVEWDTVG
ncbi:MAG: hypothetical protein IJU57_04365 [Clostridia bacterium]|nr:hypothetical protein [Clostridia bacterium]